MKLEDWKAAVDAATASISCLDRASSSPTKEEESSSENEQQKDSGPARDESGPKVIELTDDGDQDEEEAELRKLAESDARREDVKRIRSKSLMRRARGNVELASWAGLQSAEEDYKQVLLLKSLPPNDERMVARSLRELPMKINAAKEKEMGEMMGKLKEVRIAH